MSKRTVAQLISLTNNVIKTNGNEEITGAKDNALRKEVIDSFLNLKDGGLVVEAEAGYSSAITPTTDYSWATKKYVDDATSSVDLSEYIRLDGTSVQTTGYIKVGNGLGLQTSDGNHSVILSPAGVTLASTQSVFLSSAVGEIRNVNGAGKVATFDFSGITDNRSITWQDSDGTVAYLSDIELYFLGVYTSLANLQAAHPTASSGEYAIVDAGSGTNAVQYIWDEDEGWVLGSGTGGVTSFNSRVGVVMPQAGDYDAFYYTKTQSDTNYQAKFTSQSANLVYRSGDAGGVPSFSALSLSDMPVFTGYVASPGIVTSSDKAFSAIQKLDGNISAIGREVGIVYNEAFGSGTIATNYTKTGAIATFVQSTGKITIDNGVGNWIESISVKNFKFANSKFTHTFKYTVKTLNTMGVGFGIKTNPYDIRFHLDQSTSSASFIRLYLNSTEISNQIRTTAQTMAVALNDVIEVVYRQVGSDTYITYTNVTTSAKLQYVYRHINNAVISPIAYSIGYATIYALAGQVELTQALIVDNNQYNPDYIFIWDSIGRGADALSDEYSWFSLLLKSGVNAVMLSAPGGSIDDFNVTEFLNTLNLYSKRAIVINGLGTNGVEVDGGATTYTKYVAFNTAISALGFTVQSATLMGSTANVNTFNASVRANIADYYDIQASIPDRIGLHPTLSGSRQIARDFLVKLKTSRNITNSDLLDYTVFRNRIVNSHTGLLVGFSPSATFTTSSTTITSAAIPAGLPTSGILKIVKMSTGESEFVEYNAKSGTQVLGLKRAQLGSTALSISIAADAYISFVHTITNSTDGSLPSFHTAGLSSGLLGAHYNGMGLTPTDAFTFKMADANIFRVYSSGTSQISVLRNSGSSFAKISLDVLVSGSPREGYGLFVNTSNQFGLLRAVAGTTLDDSVPLFSSNTSGNLSFGLHSKTYRLTNAGSDVTSDFLIHPTKNTVATVKKYALDNTNGFVFIDVNSGAIPIANASLKTNVTTNTAGSETASLDVFTNSAGSGMAVRAQFGSYGIQFPTAGQGIQIKGGTNSRIGTGTLASGTVTISNTSITANTRIFCFASSSGIITNPLRETARVVGASFTIGTGNPTDTASFSWYLIEEV